MIGSPDTDGLLGRAFAQALVRLHVRMTQRWDEGAPDAAVVAALEHWGQRVWEATAEGHACVRVDDGRAREALAASPVVALQQSSETPLVLDAGMLYLQRLWRAESRLAALLVSLDTQAPLADEASLDTVLAQVAPASEVDEQQRLAIRTALSRRLTIGTGGPGTGKTTTLARLLAAFSRLAPGARVAIAAPTGKAAARLAQALAAQLESLASAGGEAAARLPAIGVTVHRLLGLRADDAAPAPGALRHDLVIVDEASMLDLELAAALAESIPAGGRLVLAGDRDQLASVEAGAVFAEACASGLRGIVTLQRNYRQRSAPALSGFAAWLRQGGIGAELPVGVAGEVEQRVPTRAEEIAAQAMAAWEPAFAAIEASAGAAQVLGAIDGHRVLCAMREGALGVAGLNAAIAARARRRVGARSAAVWYPGRIVMVTRNRTELGLSNGDAGVCLRDPSDPGALAVAFATGGEVRWLPVRQMPAHEDAFAITVHKSQGSEFDFVALVPAVRGHRLNTAELLYTGATRARRRLVVWADAVTLEEGAGQRTVRHGWLGDRILAQRRERETQG